MGNVFGRFFRIATWGESHGGGIGVVVDGCPPRIPLTVEEVQLELDRRRPGQSSITTQRREPDRVEILSGLGDGVTTGAPIALLVRNRDARSKDYSDLKDLYRPSHADFTYDAKFGVRSWQGGGRASARETVGRVAAGALAQKILRLWADVEIVAWVSRVHDIEATVDAATVTREAVDATPVRCPDADAAARMIERIEAVRKEGDSVGGLLTFVARSVPEGLGAPVFDRLEADLAKAMLSLPATKGFEIGSGFAGTTLKGSEHNDPFVRDGDRVRAPSNRSGGVQGGISNGEPVYGRVAFKPTATINKEQDTVDTQGRPVKLRARGRHDPCVLPRAVPMVEAMVSLVLVDHLLALRAQCGFTPRAGAEKSSS